MAEAMKPKGGYAKAFKSHSLWQCKKSLAKLLGHIWPIFKCPG